MSERGMAEPGDDDTITILIDPGALLDNLIDVLAEDDHLFSVLTDAVWNTRKPSDPATRSAAAAELNASDDLRAALTHVLTEDQARDLSAEVDHALRVISAVEPWNPFERDQTYKED